MDEHPASPSAAPQTDERAQRRRLNPGGAERPVRHGGHPGPHVTLTSPSADERTLVREASPEKQTMYTSILVALDGSAFAERALPVAIALARRSDARLSLVHVDEPHAWPPVALPTDPRLETEPWSGIHRALDALADRIRAQHGIQTAVTCLEGSAARALARHVASSDAELLVMATHGSGGLSRAWLGSVADHMVRHSAVPVLLVRPGATGAARGEPLFRRILVPLDGSSLAERALEHAVSLALPGATAFTLLQVVVPESVPVPPYAVTWAMDRADLARRMREGVTYLERPRADLAENGFTAAAEVVGNRSVARGILDYARKHDVDLIALATHGRGGVGRLLMGSVADKILRGARMPLLIYHPPGTEDVVGPLGLPDTATQRAAPSTPSPA